MVLGRVLVGNGQWSWAGCWWELANGLGLGAGGNWPMVLGWVLVGIVQLANGRGKSAERAGSGRLSLEAWP